MSAAVQELIRAFEALPASEKNELAVAILRRASPTEDISEAVLHELADERFRGYDANEAANADSQSR